MYIFWNFGVSPVLESTIFQKYHQTTSENTQPSHEIPIIILDIPKYPKNIPSNHAHLPFFSDPRSIRVTFASDEALQGLDVVLPARQALLQGNTQRKELLGTWDGVINSPEFFY